jgi:hypothetical protein
MPDPQQNAGTTSSAQTTTPDTTAGPDLTGLRVRSLQQAKAELPQPKITPPWEDEPELKLPPTSKLGQAYEHAKQFLDTHEQHLSEKYLAPFRTGLDRMAEDLEYAGESGHTKSGGTLTGPTRALASGAGAALRMVPVGRDVKETALMSVVPPELGPETKAAFKELKTGERVAEKVAPNLEGLRVRKVEPAPQKSPFRIAAETPEKHAEFQAAVKNTEGAELHDKGLTLDVARQQKPEQAGERAIRSGVFFLPEKKSPYQRYYTTGRQGYGGSQRIEGRTTFENPIIAKGASGGKVPERAYDAINGPGAYDEMRQDVLDATTHSFGFGTKDPEVLTQRVAGVLEQYGGNPEMAADIVRTSKEGNTLPYAIQEHIVASSVRKAGHDGIVGYSKVKGQHRLSEVFDLRRDKYPISSQLFEPSPKSPDLEGLRTREVSPATAEKSKVVSPAKEVPKPPQHEAVGIHSDNLPRRAKYQDVDFSAQDLQDSAKKVTPETIRKDYAGGKKDVSVYQAHIPMEDLPSAKFVEPEEENFDRGEYSRPRVGVPIKVAVNKDGSLEILDGNHRAQTWEEQGQEYAPAWVIDRRGAGIEKLSEDELAERAEEEAERNKPVTPFEKIDLTKNIPNDEAVKTEIPLSKLSVSNKSYSAAESNIAQGRGSKTEGPVQVFYNPDNKQFLVADGMHRVVEAHKKGKAALPAQVWSGYSDYIANVRPEELKNLSSQSEQAAKSLYTPEGAQPLADKLGAKVVGSVATGKTSPDPYGINRGPKDLDLRIEGDYKPDEIIPKLKAEGFEPRGSSVVSPEEVKKSGKDYGGPGWKRIEHFENAAGHKVDVFHDGAAKSWEIHDLGKDRSIPSEEGYLYHATNHERAHDIAESGLDVHKPSYGTDQEAWPDGSTDKRSYFTQKADHAWQFAPEEGKPALLRMKQDPAIHSRESTGDFYSKKKIPANKIEVLGDDKQWHPVSELSESNAGSQTDKLIQHVNKKDWYHTPPAEGQAAYAKRGQFFASNYKDAEFYGRPLDEPQNPQIKKPLVGDETAIAKELGIAPQKEGMTREQIAEHDKQWGSAAKQKGYDSILLMSPDQWKEFQSTGKIPRSLELQHLDKLETAPKVPVHEKLFSQALEAVGPGTKQSAAKIKGNYSSESEASTEAISRLTSEKKGGIQRLRVDSRSGREVPLVGVGNIDVRPGPYDYIIQRGPQGDTILDAGQRARPFRPKQRP